MELLHDDSTAAIRSWIGRSTSEPPAGFGRDIHVWLVVLLDGDARTRPRSPATVRVHFSIAPALRRAFGGNTRPPAGGHLRRRRQRPGAAARSPTLQRHTALRSLLRFAERHSSTSPTHPPTQRRPDLADPPPPRRGPATERTLLPMTAEVIQAVQQAATTPPQRLAIAWQPCTPPGPRPSASSPWTTSTCPAGASPSPGPSSPSAARPHRVCWPGWPPARHLAAHHQPARAGHAHKRTGRGPVSADYLDKHRLRGVSLDHIRRDRILLEALATGADPLHLSLVFNIDHTNAMAYANAARNLLTSPAEQPPPGV